MSEALLQAYIPSLAVLIVVALGILVNNSRFSDLNTNMNKRIDDLRADTRQQNADLREMYTRLEAVVLGKLAEVETRLDRIEGHLNLH